MKVKTSELVGLSLNWAKVLAKKALRELNNPFLRVTYGPDHKKYRG